MRVADTGMICAFVVLLWKYALGEYDTVAGREM